MLRWLPIAAIFAAAGPAFAQAPEQLEQLEPESGEWQFEYYGLVADDGEDEHSLQALYGVSDRLALGVEVEAAWSGGELEFEGIAPTALLFFSDPEEDAVGIGVEGQAEFDGDFDLASLEARLILEKRTSRWWLQGNAMLRHERESGGWETGLAYGWAVSRSLADGVWLGLEGSGQADEGGQFAGPALTFEHDLPGGSEIEIGLAYQRRLAGEGARNSARLFVQFNL